jgi:hypothetical protein
LEHTDGLNAIRKIYIGSQRDSSIPADERVSPEENKAIQKTLKDGNEDIQRILEKDESNLKSNNKEATIRNTSTKP